MTASVPPPLDTLVTTEWLSRHLDDHDLVVLDCSVITRMLDDGDIQNESGRAAYEAGHVPTAGFADLEGDLSEAKPVEFSLPTPDRFCAAMGVLGVGDDSRVVLYDNHLSFWAARVWWMLRWVGFDRAALLDGGLKLWRAEGRRLSTDLPAHPVRTLTPSLRPEVIADRDEVFAAIDDDSINLVDTLMGSHYRGQMPSLYGRPGHIPSATNLCALDLLDETGRYRAKTELAAMHELDRHARTIAYCGGGIMASGSAFVMTRLGFDDVAVYTASLQEWAKDPANPMVV